MVEDKKELISEELSEAAKDSDAIQQAMIDKAVEHSDDTMAMAANTYGVLQPRFEAYVNTLSKKQLKRLINALSQFPLNEKDFNHRGSEKEAFLIGNRLLEAKYCMVMHTYLEEMHNINAKLEEEKNKENNGKDNNDVNRQEEETL